MRKNIKTIEYCDKLGRISGEGRLVNSHKYFIKDKEDKNRTGIIEEDNNKYKRKTSVFDKYSTPDCFWKCV